MPSKTFSQMEADRAFAAADRAARRAAVACRLRRRRCGCGPLRVLEPVHRVSVARARGALMIDAVVEA